MSSLLFPKIPGLKLKHIIVFLFLSVIQTWATNCYSQSITKNEESFTVIMNGVTIGHLEVTNTDNTLEIDYDFKNNGRGPTIKETIILNEEGFPTQWNISGNTTFGNSVLENFKLQGDQATWTDATGEGRNTLTQRSLYIPQSGSPYNLSLAARILLKEPGFSLSALPGGQLQLKEIETFKTNYPAGNLNLKTFAISGADLNPRYFVLDENQKLFAYITPGFIIIRSGFEREEKSMRELAEKYLAERSEKLQAQFAHNYNGNIRIRNVRIFDPMTEELGKLASVLVSEGIIKSIDAPDVKAAPNETKIDGKGGSLIAGLYEMHAHMNDNEALLNIAAGVTSVRDTGNQNEVLDNLIKRIENGTVAGPRITRLGLIEGKSPFNVSGGILVENEQQALEAVENYAEKGFHGIKLYNSMNGDWAPAIVKKARELNMPVAGHVPAFSNANAMLRAGFDEMTHINQIMLGWVLRPEEDTRTLLRLTALKRLPNLDLDSQQVKETLNLMMENKVAVDPTLTIHEALLLSRNGETRIGSLDYIENMPANVQRSEKVAMAKIETEEDDEAYRLAFDKIIETLKLMKEHGILILPGTDMGGGLNLHRELELFQLLGYSPAEILKLGTYDMAEYLGHKDRGSIEPGMLADFFLVPGDPTLDLKAIKTISMVSRGGVIYFPSEIYPEFGITPFVEKPAVKVALH